jgi:uncharacterized protein HemX
MKKETKIIVGILIAVVVLGIGIFAFTQWMPSAKEEPTANETSNQNGINETEKEKTENKINNTNNATSTTNSENTQTNHTTNTNLENTTEPQGKEEQESKQENQGVNLEEKAIELAKQKWGNGAEAYTFSVDSKQGNFYHIAIYANATVIEYMKVNVDTGEVIEEN